MTSCTVGPDRVHYISAHNKRLSLSLSVPDLVIKAFTEHDMVSGVGYISLYNIYIYIFLSFLQYLFLFSYSYSLYNMRHIRGC